MKSLLDSFHETAGNARNRKKKKEESVKVDFDIGDFVLVAAIQPDKLAAMWQGPFRVVDPWVFVVESLVTGARKDCHAQTLVVL